ncbi:hypothetical protein CGRA01v4_04378 [Colletotrichum graminicola]|nr:hypothetical protein CGRA01v4_04378 [Colletotrichum graminicola]
MSPCLKLSNSFKPREPPRPTTPVWFRLSSRMLVPARTPLASTASSSARLCSKQPLLVQGLLLLENAPSSQDSQRSEQNQSSKFTLAFVGDSDRDYFVWAACAATRWFKYPVSMLNSSQHGEESQSTQSNLASVGDSEKEHFVWGGCAAPRWFK